MSAIHQEVREETSRIMLSTIVYMRWCINIFMFWFRNKSAQHINQSSVESRISLIALRVVGSSHLYLYSTLYTTDCVKAALKKKKR